MQTFFFSFFFSGGFPFLPKFVFFGLLCFFGWLVSHFFLRVDVAPPPPLNVSTMVFWSGATAMRTHGAELDWGCTVLGYGGHQ